MARRRFGLVTFALLFCSAAFAHAAMAANGVSARLLALEPGARANELSAYVGAGCAGETTLYMGNITSRFITDNEFWSVRCQDGREFAVEVHPDGGGSALEYASRFNATNKPGGYFAAEGKYRKSGGFCPFLVGIRNPSAVMK